ncbi:MMPL family transporter [Nocardiopsis sp. Huas11]|uniref:MMPL family transporter n=1 Tax=Nocardiopsis sp. Huas11 TaxID=2183912 RepID=UPI001F1A47F8|nr:MMPL family transporter [Nocardiopsis sp. Huas11]
MSVLLAALAFAVFAVFWGTGLFPALGSAGYADPDTESERADRLIEREFGDITYDAVVVYDDESGALTVDAPDYADAVTSAVDGIPDELVESVVGHWSPGLTEEERELLVSEDRTATYVAIRVTGETEVERLASYEQILPLLEADGLQNYMGGELNSLQQLQSTAMEDLGSAQVIAFPILFVLLVIIFRGLVAAIVPLVLGMFSILGSMVLLRLLTSVTDISVFALQITAMLGLGLAIDYGLFLVSRFRDELARHDDVGRALPATLATAGRTVTYSGLTVVVALAGLLLFPQPVSRSFGLGGMTVVLFTIISAVVVLPAILALLGRRINALALPRPRRRTVDAAATSETGFWASAATVVMRRPVVSLVASGAVLLIVASALLTLNPGLTNHRYLPADNDGHISSNMIRDEFPSGGPAEGAIDIAVVGNTDPAGLADYAERLDGLEAATGAAVERTNDDTALVSVGFSGDPDDTANLDLVREIRAESPPAGATEILVGGPGGPALTLDNTASTLAALPVTLLVVVTATLVLLFFAFRSVLLPIKAVLLGFLSLAASLGIMTWGVQEGGFASVLGFEPVGTTDIWTYAIIVVIAFGLITDYETFIVSRAREEYLATGDNTRAVKVGLQRTGGIISSAALLMVVVLGTTGIMSDSLVITTIGIGLAVAMILDATLVRALVVPASMRLFGDLNWWAPRFLRPRGGDGSPDGAPAPPAKGARDSHGAVRTG